MTTQPYAWTDSNGKLHFRAKASELTLCELDAISNGEQRWSVCQNVGGPIAYLTCPRELAETIVDCLNDRLNLVA